RMLALAAPMALAAAAAVLLYVRARRDVTAELVAFAERAPRPEVRLSYAPYDRYRPREVARSGSPSTRAPVPLAALAKLDERGELGGVAATCLLARARDHAPPTLELPRPSPA